VILVDGRPADSVPVTDRGLNYGDGLFETLRLHRGRVPLLPHHIERLRQGCERLGLPWPGEALLGEELARVSAGDAEGVLKIVLTRGDGGRGYAPGEGCRGRRIVSRHPLPAELGQPLTVGVCRTPLGMAPAVQGLKHLGRLEQVLAAREAAAAGWGEGLMLDAAGHVVEGTRHHLFYLRSGRILTPPRDGLAVDGILRKLVVDSLAAAAIPAGEAVLRYDELHEVEAMVLCNAVAGVRGVSALAGRPLPAGTLVELLRPMLAARGVTWLG
jgi:4-amino-4-deoxychorismate lyase